MVRRVRHHSEREDSVGAVWEDHMRTPFPDRLRGEEIAGVDMVMLDADIVGCVDSWRGNHGSLDDDRRRSLIKCTEDLDLVLPLLTDPAERRFYDRLRELARMILS